MACRRRRVHQRLCGRPGDDWPGTELGDHGGGCGQRVIGVVEQHHQALAVDADERGVSGELAEKLGVRHETPQVLLIKDGRAVQAWNHRSIRKKEIEKAVAE